MPARLYRMLALFFFITTPALGNDNKHSLFIDVKQEYNDNIFFDEGSGKRDYITTLTPGLSLATNTERIKASFTGKIDQRLYRDNDDLNATDQLFRGNIQYSHSPRIMFTGRADYIKDSSPDRDLRTTGLVLDAIRRQQQRYSLDWSYGLSERTTATFAYAYSKESWDSVKFTDTKSHSANILFVRYLDGYQGNATKGRAGLGYSRYRFAESQVDNYQAKLGLSRAVSEVWDFLIDAGISYNSSSFEVSQFQFIPPAFVFTTKTIETEGWGAVGEASVSYRGSTTDLQISFSHNILPASGRVGTSRRSGLTVNISRQFAYELSGRISAGYFLNKADREELALQAIDTQSLYVNPVVAYHFTRDMLAEASYTYTTTDDKTADTRADRNLFLLRFSYLYPLSK